MRGIRMPDWFRRGVKWLVHPDQCVACGQPLTEPVGRRTFIVFCSQECAEAWESFGDKQ